jgi:hypothetical protein
MKKRAIPNNKNNNCESNSICKCNSSGAIYGLGFIGSLVYYLSNATGFWLGFLGFLKSLVWPAFLVYELLKFLGA